VLRIPVTFHLFCHLFVGYGNVVFILRVSGIPLFLLQINCTVCCL